MQKRKQFRIEPLRKDQIPYEGLVDRHLEYFFASKFNRQTLIKTRLVNRKNEIIDKNICKLIKSDHLPIHNSFRLKKSSSKNRYESNLTRGDSSGKTVSKKDFQQFLQSRRNLIKYSTAEQTAQTGHPHPDARKINHSLDVQSLEQSN